MKLEPCKNCGKINQDLIYWDLSQIKAFIVILDDFEEMFICEGLHVFYDYSIQNVWKLVIMDLDYQDGFRIIEADKFNSFHKGGIYSKDTRPYAVMAYEIYKEEIDIQIQDMKEDKNS